MLDGGSKLHPKGLFLVVKNKDEKKSFVEGISGKNIKIVVCTIGPTDDEQ